jgi:hypothetical protein
MSSTNLWKRFQQHLCQVPTLGLTLDGWARSDEADAPGETTFRKT